MAAPGGGCSVSGGGDLGLAGILAPSSPLGHGAGFLFLGLSNSESMVPPVCPWDHASVLGHLLSCPPAAAQLGVGSLRSWCSLQPLHAGARDKRINGNVILLYVSGCFNWYSS